MALTTLTFQGRGKTSARKVWDVYPDVTNAFLEVINNPFIPLTIDSPMFAAIERFVVTYDKTSASGCVNITQRELFTKRARELGNILPRKVFVLNHLNRSILIRLPCGFPCNLSKSF